MQGHKILLTLIAFTLSSGVIAAPYIPYSQLMKRDQSSTLPNYDAPSIPSVRKAASTDAPTASKGGASGASDAAPAAATAGALDAAPAAAGNPFTQVLGDITNLDPLAAVSDLATPITGALPIKV